MQGMKLLMTGVLLSLLAGPALAAEDTIKIGVPGAHTGDLAAYGQPSLNAVMLVVEEQNAKGGLLGKQIEVIPQDDQCKAELATNAATKLLSEKVAAVVGPICSGPTKATMTIFNEARIVNVTPSATDPQLTMTGTHPYFFRAIAKDDAQGEMAARFLAEKLQAKKVAIVHDNGDYGRGYAEFVRDNLQKIGGVEVVLFEAITTGAVDFSSVSRKIRNLNADAVVFGGYYSDGSKLIMSLRKNRVKAPFIGPDGLKSDQFINMAGKAAEGVYASYPTDTSRLPAYVHATDLHQKKFHTEPGAFYYNGFSAALALLNAIEKAGSTDSDKIAAALREYPVDTPIGTVKFDERGDVLGLGMSMYQVQQGKFAELK